MVDLTASGIGIVAGLAILGKKVIKPLKKTTHLTPSRGFVTNLPLLLLVVSSRFADFNYANASWCGNSVGMARGIAALNLGVIRNIVVSG